MGMIIESGQITDSDADILNGTRLATAPANGILTVQLQSSHNDDTDHYVSSLQRPGGDVPMTDVRVPCGNTDGLAGVLDDRTLLGVEMPIQQGGQVLLSATREGADSLMTWRVVFRF